MPSALGLVYIPFDFCNYEDDENEADGDNGMEMMKMSCDKICFVIKAREVEIVNGVMACGGVCETLSVFCR